MAQVRNIRPGYTVIHPSRDRAICKLTKLLVVATLLASVAVMLVLTVGGWSKLQGMKPLNFIWSAAYVVMAVYIWRWARGLLPIAAVLAVLLLIIAVIAAAGLDGTSWFDRTGSAYAAPQSLFGGNGLTPDTLGTLTVVLAGVQLALIVTTIVGFAQRWNVELEVPEDEARRRGSTPIARGPQATPA
ncbi:MAG: hypothetical protein WAL63_20660 [Solirubrobacteraceae bacterium]